MVAPGQIRLTLCPFQSAKSVQSAKSNGSGPYCIPVGSTNTGEPADSLTGKTTIVVSIPSDIVSPGKSSGSGSS